MAGKKQKHCKITGFFRFLQNFISLVDESSTYSFGGLVGKRLDSLVCESRLKGQFPNVGGAFAEYVFFMSCVVLLLLCHIYLLLVRHKVQRTL